MGTYKVRPASRTHLIVTGSILSAVLSIVSFLVAYVVLG